MTGYIGVITTFAGNYAPTSWAFCNGQVLPIASNQALFAILSKNYGGDGTTTFALPDLRGRSAIQSGTGVNLSAFTLGQKGGAAAATMVAANVPPHLHAGAAPTSFEVGTSPDTDAPGADTFIGPVPNGFNTNYTQGALMAAPTFSNVVMQPTAGAAIPVMSPYLALNFIICISGYFPTRD
ncbi:MAG: phage tail protein [Sphingobacteriales bacterium]|nr:MAG: phage tail protein [Sphingobacteriales bacterium]